MKHAQLMAAYYMAKFNSSLGFGTQIKAFEHVSHETQTGSVKIYRDVFDRFGIHRAGFKEDNSAHIAHWPSLEPLHVNDKGRSEIENMLKTLGLWSSYTAAIISIDV